ncbi:hypothetical protein, partial [Sinorhizobium meliloti]|uniref:hypothetical protein n=1 Tax=Rhizobium meliloti TaxID=382 RepID=UPI001AECA022
FCRFDGGYDDVFLAAASEEFVLGLFFRRRIFRRWRGRRRRWRLVMADFLAGRDDIFARAC